jgi:hypothetical protein
MSAQRGAKLYARQEKKLFEILLSVPCPPHTRGGELRARANRTPHKTSLLCPRERQKKKSHQIR